LEVIEIQLELSTSFSFPATANQSPSAQTTTRLIKCKNAIALPNQPASNPLMNFI
jgi:hypothetical protein